MRAADRVEDHVELRQPALPATLRVVDHVVEAELADALVLAGRGRAVDLSARALGDLGGGDAHAAPGRVHEHALAGLQRPVADQARPRGPVVDRDRRPLLEAELLGQREHVGGGHRDLRGVAAEHGRGEHALARREGRMGIRNAGAQLEDRAGDLVADDAGRLRRVRVQAHAGHHVGEVDARRGDLDAHRPGLQLRVRALLHLQHSGPPCLVMTIARIGDTLPDLVSDR